MRLVACSPRKEKTCPQDGPGRGMNDRQFDTG